MTITATFETFEEMENFARQLLSKAAPEPVKAEPEPVPAAAPAPAQATTPTTASAPTPEPVKAEPKKPAAPSRQEVQKKAIALMDLGKQAQLQELLAKYNVQALPSLSDDKLAAFAADMEML